MRAVTVHRLDDGNNKLSSYRLNGVAEFDKLHDRQFARRVSVEEIPSLTDSCRNAVGGNAVGGLVGIALAVAGCGGGSGGSNPPIAPAPTVVVQPWPLPGTFAVACSNVVQDFSQVGSGEDATNYWEGTPSDTGMPRYATDLLADPGNTLIATVTAPQDSNLFGSFAGDNVRS